MKWLPASMFGRTALIMIAAVMVGQLVTVVLLNQFVNQPRINLGVGQFVTHLKTIRAALDTMHESEHSAFIAALNERDGIRILRMRPDNNAVPVPDRQPFRFFRERVREVLGPEAEVFSRPQNPRVVFVQMRAGSAEYWIAFPRARLERDPAITVLMAAMVGALIALATASFVVWRLNRPLRSLARAAHNVAQGAPTPVAEGGPAEIRAVAREFNRMQDVLAQTERERATFLAGVSHDLRTPLARLRLGLEMSGADAASQAGMVADLEEMNQVIEQFISFARDESSEPLVSVNIGELLQRVCDNCARQQRPVTLSAGSVMALNARPLALARLFANLIDNAHKYSNNARVEVSASLVAGAVVVDVADRGPGIPISEVARLKQPFARQDAARGGPIGAGLGLAIAERVARMHGGKLDLLPREGGGLVARVTLPV
jgi:two-component system, OmpR family, osmolarity sensor histidine kinase EnvZ